VKFDNLHTKITHIDRCEIKVSSRDTLWGCNLERAIKVHTSGAMWYTYTWKVFPNEPGHSIVAHYVWTAK
jgi:hypothetical protein